MIIFSFDKNNKNNEIVEHFKNIKRLIDNLIDNSSIRNKIFKQEKHPLVIKYNLCEEIIDQNGKIKSSVDDPKLNIIASNLLFSYILSKVSGGNKTNLSLGNFANYGDQKVRQRILTQLEDPIKFQSLMTEIIFGGWFSDKSEYTLTATEDEGLADFKIDVQSYPIPLVVDCKFIEKNTNDNRYKKNIEKANKQIKKWKNKLGSEVYGLVVMDVSNQVGLNNNIHNIPDKVQEIQKIILKSIKNNNTSVNTSVSAVLLIWDNFEIKIEENTTSQSIVFAKNSIIVHHSNPKNKLPKNIIPDNWGYTAGYNIQNNT